MRNYYQDFKNLYDGIKPIRGRAEDVRPIGQRRRDWERIEMDGDVVACRLYNTQCVRYYPDGRIGVACDTWSTPLTADFIHTHSPWQCFKRYKKLWVMVPDADSSQYFHYPVPHEGELVFEWVNGGWRPTTPVMLEKQVIDRDKAKAAREPVKPFLKWAKAFLGMSDGWIMHETRKQVFGGVAGWGYVQPHFSEAEVMDMMCSGDEDKYLLAMCVIFGTAYKDSVDRREAETVMNSHGFKSTYYDIKHSFDLLRNRVDRIVKSTSDVYKKVQVDVEINPQTGIA